MRKQPPFSSMTEVADTQTTSPKSFQESPSLLHQFPFLQLIQVRHPKPFRKLQYFNIPNLFSNSFIIPAFKTEKLDIDLHLLVQNPVSITGISKPTFLNQEKKILKNPTNIRKGGSYRNNQSTLFPENPRKNPKHPTSNRKRGSQRTRIKATIS